MQKISKTTILFGSVGIVIIAVAGIFLYRFFTLKKSHVINPPVAVVSAPVQTTSTPPAIQVIPKPVVPTVDPITAEKNILAQKLTAFNDTNTTRFVVQLTDTEDTTAQALITGGYITDAKSFLNYFHEFADGKMPATLATGGYRISQSMTTEEIAYVFSEGPYMKWVVIPEGLRKEEIADLLATALGWSKTEESNWITVDTGTNAQPGYVEGVYFPDTYLIPIAETGAQVAARLIAEFNTNFAPYLPQFTAKNIKWTTGLTLASIVQREAENASDMPLIAGILWNRLDQNMPLDVDSTVQYARGNTGSGWWAPITVADEQINSPFNTYLHTGLPPHPISNPGIPAINAVLNPTQTTCLYYLHDKNGVIHCADTYAEQEANIQEYLD